MLTGDKLETAESIGYSTKLLTPSMSLIKVATPEDIQKQFNGQ
jgi:magnesium-transporting ATPase (P-type)